MYINSNILSSWKFAAAAACTVRIRAQRLSAIQIANLLLRCEKRTAEYILSRRQNTTPYYLFTNVYQEHERKFRYENWTVMENTNVPGHTLDHIWFVLRYNFYIYRSIPRGAEHNQLDRTFDVKLTYIQNIMTDVILLPRNILNT